MTPEDNRKPRSWFRRNWYHISHYGLVDWLNFVIRRKVGRKGIVSNCPCKHNLSVEPVSFGCFVVVSLIAIIAWFAKWIFSH